MIYRIPLLRPIIRAIMTPVKAFTFPGSKQYWESRYAAGDTSGQGSYGDLAKFKAEVLNNFVHRNNIKSVVEFGCGDGAQLALAEYPQYLGLDISKAAINLCSNRFSEDETKCFTLYLPEKFHENIQQYEADLAISLDVIYHLVEEAVFNTYMHHLFISAKRYVIIYSSNFDKRMYQQHIRHRKFSRWIEKNQPRWKLIDHIPNRYPVKAQGAYGSFADFHIYSKI